MNWFARILSHGFGLAVVALIAIGLMYRGQLFPEWELPGFLQFGSSDERIETATGGQVSRAEAPADALDTATDTAGQDVPAAAQPSQAAPSMPGAETGTMVDDTPVGAGVAALAAGQDASASVADADTGETVVGETPVMVADPQAAAPGESPAADAVDAPATDPGAASDAATAAEPATPAPVEQAMPATAAPTAVEHAADAPAATSPATEDTASVAPAEPAVPSPATEETATVTPAAAAAATSADAATTGQVDTVTPETSAAADDTPATASPVAAATSRDGAGQPVAGQSSYRLLATAREAYWLRDYDAAEQHYRALIELQPGNPDGFGELGNMYFSQGRWSDAAAAYFDAGKRLADEGIYDQAEQLVDVIRGLQGTQADELDAYIKQRQGAAQ